MNSITIAGGVTRDAEIKYLPDGTAIANFSVADNFDKDKTQYWNCSIFGKRAESVGQYILKGNKVTVVGQAIEESWTDKNGQERKTMKVRINDIALQGKPAQQDEYQQAPRQAAPAPRNQGTFDDMDDDVPFSDPMKSRAYCLSI